MKLMALVSVMLNVGVMQLSQPNSRNLVYPLWDVLYLRYIKKQELGKKRLYSN